MKVYRVVPNTFSVGKRLDLSSIPGGEDLFYKMGYASFVGERGFHKYNNVFESNNSIDDGKYFFLFPEDAVKQGYYLLTMFHKLDDVGSFCIVEYDFPDDIVLKHFGYGDYLNNNGAQNFLVESFVEKKDFSIGDADVGSTKSLSSHLVKKTMFESLKEVLNIAERIVAFSPNEFVLYDDYFERNYWGNFYDVVDNEEMLQEILQNSRLFKKFLFMTGELIKTPYLTGRILLVNMEEIMFKFRKWQEAADYFQTMGLRFDVTQEQKEFKSELLRLAGYNSSGTKHVAEVKKLLKERGY